MIESRYWRQELRTALRSLRRQRVFRRWSAKRQILFERQLMLVAFQIRALLDRPYVRPTARDRSVDAQLYKKVGTGPVTMLNSISFDRHFDLDRPTGVRLSIRDVCNQLVHHYVLFALRGVGQFEVVLVFSDYKRHVGLYQINIDDVLDLFAVFAAEESAAESVTMIWNQKRQDYDFSTGP